MAVAVPAGPGGTVAPPSGRAGSTWGSNIGVSRLAVRWYRDCSPGLARSAAFLSWVSHTVARVRVQEARLLAQVMLDDPATERRWAHVCRVARRAEELAGLLRLDAAAGELLVCAAWLHDIGYAPLLTGRPAFHPVDGARFLRRFGAPAPLYRLVARHSGAAVEAAVRGRSADLAEFPAVAGVICDALTAVDMQTSPNGRPVSVRARVVEILTRYPQGHPVHTAVSRSAPHLAAAVARTTARIHGSDDE